MQTPVPVTMNLSSPTWADVRVNLAVPFEEKEECERAGGRFDEKNLVYYSPPRVDLRPVGKWLLNTASFSPAKRRYKLNPATRKL